MSARLRGYSRDLVLRLVRLRYRESGLRIEVKTELRELEFADPDFCSLYIRLFNVTPHCRFGSLVIVTLGDYLLGLLSVVLFVSLG